MRIALVHEWLTTMGGSENVLAALYEIYPSPIYTLLVNRDSLKGTIFENASIKTSFIQNLPFAKKKYRSYLSLFPIAVEQFDLSGFDVILSSSHCVAKGVLTGSNQLHICYCHTPMRYAWDLYHRYLKQEGLKRGLKSIVAKQILHKIRMWDILSSNRVDHFIANSLHIARKIEKIYRRDAHVIYPPVDIERFDICTQKENYYITASRMVPYKMIDLIVKAFVLMPDRKLVVVGDGPDFKKIKKLSKKNIELLGYQSFEALKNHLKKAKAFIFAAEEDFGILPVEAQACGTPIIAYGRGGALETVVPEKSGIFFYEQSEESIINAVERFDKIEEKFQPDLIRKGVEKFNKQRFKEEFKRFVEKKAGSFLENAKA